ncbi:hypothetical protein BT96DRAFT_1002385 [Gymnopus androsaceus JB14]|uniref:cellulase n=1 Tax=Gymnopus androsaceus JB14 TaxID=1447944 RepID=A0A6A4GX36_9AGAR|nr:hypothetical protein BT96DRAFT_1002385 [Gymnopus androsaceus JB14]
MGLAPLCYSTIELIFDVHKYLDVDNSGTNEECITNNESSWVPLAKWLRANGRQAETKGGNVASCVTFMCQQIAYQAHSSGDQSSLALLDGRNFYLTYVLFYDYGEAPTQTGTTWTDILLASSCMPPAAGVQSSSTGQ